MSQPPDSDLAIPAGDHCISGTLHVGTARGTTKLIEEAPTYITSPEPRNSNGNILFYFPDVHGLFNNALLLMDGFAGAGYKVFGIDYFRDDPIWKHRKDKEDTTTDPGFDLVAWREKHYTFAQITIPKWISAIASEYGDQNTKYCCVGYCFGAPFVLESLTSSSIISAGAFAHPSKLTDSHFHEVAKPVLLSCADNDHAFPAESRHRAEAILKEGKKRYQVQLFQGVGHGFAVRCDLDVPYERFVKEQSHRGIVEWFDLWLAQ